MKKLLLFFIVGSCFFSSIAEIKHSDAAMAAIKKRPCSKKYAHTEYNDKISLFHYIFLEEGNNFSDILLSYYKRIKKIYNL